MSHLYQKAIILLSNPQSVRLVMFGLALAGLLVSLGVPEPVAACLPPSPGESGGC